MEKREHCIYSLEGEERFSLGDPWSYADMALIWREANDQKRGWHNQGDESGPRNEVWVCLFSWAE